MDAFIGLIILATIILLGIFGEIFFRKTGIPDALWLIFFGFLITHILKIIEPTIVDNVLSVIMAITLIIILFEGGLHLDLVEVIKYTLTGSGLAIFSFIFSTIFITLFTYGLHLVNILPNWNIWSGIILGAIVGGTSSIIVIPLLKLANLDEEKTNILSVESAITDALCVVVVMTLLGYLASKSANLKIIFQNVISSFAIAIVFGILFAIIWLIALLKLKEKENMADYFYFLTLSMLFFLYVIVEYFGGSAVVAIFIFGLMLGNSKLLNRIFKTNFYNIDKKILLMNSQIAFLIKSFFFVIMGILLKINLKYMLLAFALTLVLLVARFLVILLIPKTRQLPKYEKRLLYFFTPKGLAAGILAITVADANVIPGSEIISYLVFGIIIFSIIFATIGMYLFKYIWTKEGDINAGENSIRN